MLASAECVGVREVQQVISHQRVHKRQRGEGNFRMSQLTDSATELITQLRELLTDADRDELAEICKQIGGTLLQIDEAMRKAQKTRDW